MVLPQPDSPTSPSVSPGKMSKLTSSTARTVPPCAAQAAGHFEVLLQMLHREKRLCGLLIGGRYRPNGSLPGELAGGDFGMPVAARQAAGVGGIERRLLLADLDLERAARLEAAARRRIGEVGRQPLDGLELGAARPVEPRHRAQQSHRVGMARPVEDFLRLTLLGDARRVHHDDAVGVARHHAEIVGDDDQRNVELARQILHQFENLRLDGDVERGGRLVGDDQLRIARESDRDHHALAHAA